MAQDEKGKRFDNRPKDPAVPAHIRNQSGLNRLQRKLYAGGDRPAGSAATAKRSGKRKGGRRSSGNPAAVSRTPAPAETVAPAPTTKTTTRRSAKKSAPAKSDE